MGRRLLRKQGGAMSNEEMKELDIFREPMAMGEIFAKSGMFPDIKSATQAVVKIMAGKELGMTPFQAMSSIYIVNGKLALTSNAMSSLVKKTKKYDYKVVKLDESECSIDFYSNEEKIGNSTFTFKDAAKAGLVNKDVWKAYPKNMLFARALSNGARWYAPDSISGYYIKEELEDSQEPDLPSKTTVAIDVEGVIKNG